RVHVELHELALELDRELRHAGERVRECVDIGGRLAAKTAQKLRTFDFVDHPERFRAAHRAVPEHDVVVHLHHDAAAAEKQHGADLRVVFDADDDFDPAAHHFLYERTRELRA